MALNDTFKILPKNKISLKADLSPFFPKKDYWAEECNEYPSKKECLFYCDWNLLFLRKLVNFAGWFLIDLF